MQLRRNKTKRISTVVEPNMKALEKIKAIRNYCDYLEKHIINVGKAWEIIQDKLYLEKQICNDFDFWFTHELIESHDLSKLDIEEFIPYAEFFYSKYGIKYDPWNDSGEGDAENKRIHVTFKEAWEHHKDNNPHHYENWTRTKEHFPGESASHVICMVADWMAMGMIFGDTAEQYYEKEKEKMALPEWANRFLYDIFKGLRG